MSNENRNFIISELLDLSPQGLRREVETCVGDILEAIWKRRFDHHGAKIAMLLSTPPHFFSGSGIPDVEQDLALVFNEESETGYDMMNADSRDEMISHRCGLLFSQFAKFHNRNALRMIRQPREIRPNVVVKEKLLEPVNNFTSTPEVDARFTAAIEVVREHREG